MIRAHRRTAAALLAALSVLAGASAAQHVDPEAVRDFQKYFRKFKDTPSRVEAVRSLEKNEAPEVVAALLPVLQDPDAEVVRAAVDVLASFSTDPPKAALAQALDQNANSAVRQGLLHAAAQGRFTLPPETLTKCLKDRDWALRHAALQALCARAAPGAAVLAAPYCADPEPAVRSAALDGLASMRAAEVVAPAVAALADPVWQVRASAIAALRQVRHRDAIEPLIARMELEEGRLVVDIGRALGAITGRNLGPELGAWKKFWAAQGPAYKIPTDEDLEKMRQRLAERATEYTSVKKEEVVYHGIVTPSRSILFVIDVSGSMENLVVDRERFKDGGYPSMMRIDIVKVELQRTLERLEPNVSFNVLAFATDVVRWKKDLTRANPVARAAAIEWVGRLEALGGNSNVELAAAGLAAAANLDAGKTNTYGALMEALGASGKASRDYQVDVDTIFFLSDGRPSHGQFVDTDDILREVRQTNELRKVVIHTIALGEFEKDFMRRLAEDSGGVFVDLGK